MTDEQIRHMAERFLSWKMPEDFMPDNGISVKRPNYAPNVIWEPTGTNLFSYAQAETMVRHMLAGLPARSAILEEAVSALEKVERQAECLERYAEGHGFTAKPVPSVFHLQAMHFRNYARQTLTRISEAQSHANQ